jgi:MOSC domain-containing protein YiiM
VPSETCDGCGFDATDYTHEDLLGTVRALAPMWRHTTEGIDESVLSIRPDSGVWSALEYASHSRDVTGVMGYLLHLALTDDHPVLEPPPPEIPDPTLPPTLEHAIRELDKNVARLNAKAARMSDDDWSRPITLGDDTVDAEWIVGHAVHDATHHLRDVSRGLHALGAGAPTQHGTLVQVNSSNGGVPKTALTSAAIGRRGVAGDQQAERRHHGRPWQAVCIWSRDVIDALDAEGHTLFPGAAGENLTVAGIDWATVRPGVRLMIGAALVEVSAFATPCAKNARWFSDGNFRRIDHNLHRGTSRAYAWVLEPGTVVPGDTVLVEP